MESIAYLRPFAERGVAIFSYEARGVTQGDDGSRCTSEFYATNTREQRLRDARTVLAQASRLVHRWDGRLIVLGASEGATIAPDIAANEPRTVALVLLAGGGWQQADELVLLERRRLERSGASPEAVSSGVADLTAMFDRIRSAPSSTELWRGHSYQWWNSYLWFSPLNA
jgi:dienelactone hydrolase